MRSLFITGTDTDVGKTYITAGLAATIHKMSIDVGVMKPFAAGAAAKSGFKSKDAQIISNAANTSDSESLVNPQFFPIPASPYTASKSLKIKPKISTILSNFKKLTALHEIVLVEGMGGIMTPITKNYHVANLIKDMRIPAIIVASNRVGTINHTIMTVEMCKKHKIPIKGLILNDFVSDGYKIRDLVRDFKGLFNVPILGSIPHVDDLTSPFLYKIFKKNLDFKLLLK